MAAYSTDEDGANHMAKVAINGFGRIGRCIARAAVRSGMLGKGFDLVAINDPSPATTIAHLLKYDSVHGKMEGVSAEGDGVLVINGKKIKSLSILDQNKLPWKELGIDVVIECTGKFTDKELAMSHIKCGAKKVIISAPGKNCDGTFVLGVNFDKYDKAKHHIISMASCTTGSLAPTVKVLDEAFGIKQGFMTTCHAYTMDQRVLDNSHKDPRRARAAAINTIPTSTGAAKSVGEVLPRLKGKMNGISLRVPVPDGSITDISIETEKPATAEQVNAALKSAAQGPMKGIMEYSEEPLVSSDIIGNQHSAIIDGLSTMVIPGADGKTGNLIKVLSWYDNEMGYSHRVVEMAAKMV